MTYATTDDGTRIHYRVTGRRGSPPVLFIQGLGADKHGWDFQRLGLAWAIQAIALDNRGSGRSDKPHGAYSLEQMADDAIAVLDDAGFGPSTSSARPWAAPSPRSSRCAIQSEFVH